ncbi:MAG: OFA family MFS transporter [Methanothrix sp.]|jgi:MFS family permease|uniref:L-lactate MFS transporter n=1 Tax=Methanothrix sp. TaxID=90426 RepID=UPI00247D7F67|nr:OFA family MFS transporter [Methanothrix sp.]
MSDDVKIMGMKAESGRWILVIAGLLIELCLGAIYAYSIINPPLKKLFTENYGLTVSATAMQIPYIVFLLIFALTMPLVGKYIEKLGPRKVGIGGGVLVGLGWILASFSTSPTTLAIYYGVIGGLGVGIAYNCPITTSARWFPDRRGLAVGLTVLGFGFSAAVTGPIADYLTANFGVLNMFRFLGIAFLIITVVLSTVLVFPPAGWTPAGWKPPEPKAGAAPKAEFMRSEMTKTTTFYGLWICYTIGTLAGLMAIGVSKPVGLEVASNAGMDQARASALMTSLIIPFAFCNGGGRPIFGWLTDKLTPPRAAMLSFILILLASLLIYTSPASISAYTISFAILWMCLGGWLAIAPTATASFFGTKDYARNYGLVFTAYGAGAVIGNIMAGQAKDIFGAYIQVFPYVAVLAVIGFIVAMTMLKPPKPKTA